MSKYIGELALPGLKEKVDAKQDKLVSGETLKTINGESLLGAGDITLGGGEGADPRITDDGAKKANNLPDEILVDVTSISGTEAGGVEITATQKNTTTGTSTSEVYTIPAASDSMSGVMTPTDKAAITSAAESAEDAKAMANAASSAAVAAATSASMASDKADEALEKAELASTNATMANNKAVEALARADELAEPAIPTESVATKVDLDAVDTSGFTGGETYEVVADETQGGKTTIYIWDAETSQWVLKGNISPYVTREEFNATLGDLNTILETI